MKLLNALAITEEPQKIRLPADFLGVGINLTEY